MLLWTSCYCSNFAEMVINLYFCEPAAPDGWCDLGSALAALSSNVLAAIWWGLHHSHVVWTFPPQGRFELFSIKLAVKCAKHALWQPNFLLVEILAIQNFSLYVYLSVLLPRCLSVSMFDLLSLCLHLWLSLFMHISLYLFGFFLHVYLDLLYFVFNSIPMLLGDIRNNS